MSRSDTFIQIVLLLVISMGVAYIAHNYLPEKLDKVKGIEGFESKLRSFPVDAVIIIDSNNQPQLIEELKTAGIPDEKIHVMKPVQRSWKELGTNLTHEAVLRTIVDRQWKRTLVFSEGVLLNYSRSWDRTVQQIEEFVSKSGSSDLDSTWDVILLGGSSTTNPAKTEYDSIIRTKDAKCSYAYMIRSEYAKRVLENVETGVQMMIKGHPQHSTYTLDNIFYSMKQEDRWFMCKPSLAYIKSATA